VNDCDLLAGLSDLYPPPLPSNALNERDPLDPRTIGFIFGVGKTRMAGLQSGEGRLMIDSVVWTQYINVTDRHTDRQTDTSPNDVSTHCVGRQEC